MNAIQQDFQTFSSQLKGPNVAPVYSRLPGLAISPIEAVERLLPLRPTFLLESLGPYSEFSRASFIGLNPVASALARPGQVELQDHRTGRTQTIEADPWQGLEHLLDRFRPAVNKELGSFWGGAVGFVGYDTIRYLEELPEHCPIDPNQLEMQFVVCRELLRFDRGTGDVYVISLAFLDEEDPKLAYDEAAARIEDICGKLVSPESVQKLDGYKGGTTWTSNMSQADYENMVEQGKEYIRAGDIIQVVLSQRLTADFEGDPLALYRGLREVNPSPYSFYLDFGDLHLVGASPEMLVRLSGERIQVRPIAGTRPRGGSPAEDEALAKELLADPKEKAEHIMLVDLGRNDIGRVARLGTVHVPHLMTVEKYSHVMHIVSHVEGVLDPKYTALDVLKCSFPAGTLSGAPKIRAMEIIEELEPERRGPYGGAVGYFGFSGDMDFCITIRTLIVEQGRAWVQAGAGIVADSVPATEYHESLHKAQAVLTALQKGQPK